MNEVSAKLEAAQRPNRRWFGGGSSSGTSSSDKNAKANTSSSTPATPVATPPTSRTGYVPRSQRSSTSSSSLSTRSSEYPPHIAALMNKLDTDLSLEELIVLQEYLQELDKERKECSESILPPTPPTSSGSNPVANRSGQSAESIAAMRFQEAQSDLDWMLKSVEQEKTVISKMKTVSQKISRKEEADAKAAKEAAVATAAMATQSIAASSTSTSTSNRWPSSPKTPPKDEDPSKALPMVITSNGQTCFHECRTMKKSELYTYKRIVIVEHEEYDTTRSLWQLSPTRSLWLLYNSSNADLHIELQSFEDCITVILKSVPSNEMWKVIGDWQLIKYPNTEFGNKQLFAHMTTTSTDSEGWAYGTSWDNVLYAPNGNGSVANRLYYRRRVWTIVFGKYEPILDVDKMYTMIDEEIDVVDYACRIEQQVKDKRDIVIQYIVELLNLRFTSYFYYFNTFSILPQEILPNSTIKTRLLSKVGVFEEKLVSMLIL